VQFYFSKAASGEPNGLFRETFNEFAESWIVPHNPRGGMHVVEAIDPPEPCAVGSEIGVRFYMNVVLGLLPGQA
jgi:hypothetical protein